MSEPTVPGRRGEELLARLFGPATAELTCEECFDALDAYVELMLAAEPADQRVPGMRAHLDGCPACAEEYRSLRDLLTPGEGGT
jgi:hypothetical protein